MDVVSLSPLQTGSLLWQQRPGTWVQTVIAKATFALRPGESPLASEQEYPNEDDNHWNDDPDRSLYSPSDLAPFKTRADVVLVGHAFAPRGEPVRSLVVRLIVGEIDKSIEVFCERSWSQEGLLREGQRFTRMPLRWERAAGGPETTNPVGVRGDRADLYGNVAVANLQPPGVLVSDPSDFLEPVGFGPIAPAWPARREKLGRHAGSWSDARWHREPLPPDIDPGYFNSAPRDQQIGALRDNERIVLEHLHPEHPRLVTSLPGIRPRAFVERPGAPPQELAMTCDTLWIDTDRSLCTLTWRAGVQASDPAQPGRVLVAMESPGQRVSWAEVERAASSVPRSGGRPPVGGSPTRIDDPHTMEVEEIAAESEPPPPPDRRHDPLVQTHNAPAAGASALPFTSAPAQKRDKVPTQVMAMVGGTPPPAPPSAPTSADAAPIGDASPAWLKPPSAASGIMPSPALAAGVASGGLPFGAPAPMPAPMAPPPAPPPPVPLPLQPPPVPNAASAAAPPSAPLPPLPASAAFTASTAPIPAPLADSPWAGGSGRAMDPVSGGASGPTAGPGLGAAQPAAAAAAPGIVLSALVPSSALSSGAVAASNAAAAAAWAASAPSSDPLAAPATRPAARAYREPRDVIELLWFDPETPPRLRDVPEWKKLLEDMKKPDKDIGFDDEVPPKPPKEVEEKKDIFGVLTRGEPTDVEGVQYAITNAIGEDGGFSPPLVLLGGELSLPFDELETLKATVTAVTPLIAGDKRLKDTVDTVNELLKTPWLQSSSGVAEGLTAKIKEAFAASSSRMLPPSYLDQHTERMLLEQRHYQRRTVFGAVWIRTLLLPPGGSTPIPTYLPEDVSKKLPMFQTVKARVIAEAHAQQDQYETHPSALKVTALGRVIAFAGRLPR